MTGASIHVEGLRELVRAFGRMNPALRLEMNRELRKLGKEVAQEAQLIAGEKGLRESGSLIGGIRTRLNVGTVSIVSTARKVSPKYPGGYDYPRRYEFERGGARAFLQPALERRAPAALQALDEIFSRMVSESGFGGGGLL